MTVVNQSDKAITLKRNCKLADVFPCLAVEDLDVFQGSQAASEKKQPDTRNDSMMLLPVLVFHPKPAKVCQSWV